jgi:hypothetical protein
MGLEPRFKGDRARRTQFDCKKGVLSWVPVAYALILAIQEAGSGNFGSKPAWANSSTRPYLEKKNHHKKGLVDWLKV